GAEAEELQQLGQADPAGRARERVPGGAHARAFAPAAGQVAAQRPRYQLDHDRKPGLHAPTSPARPNAERLAGASPSAPVGGPPTSTRPGRRRREEDAGWLGTSLLET